MIDPEIRRLGIGGSEIGAIFGVDSNRDAFSVWAAKKGGLPPSEPDERMRIGKALEPGVLELYEYVTGRSVKYCDQTSVHPERPWMVYTPDALCIAERRGVDAKVVAWDQRRLWGPTVDDIPERITLQCWWYMAALDYDVWDVAALVGDGLPRVYEIRRDREGERVMLQRVEEFWRRFIVGDDMPPIGTSTHAGAWLQRAFPRHQSPDLRTATDEEMLLLGRYAAVRVTEKAAKDARAELENRIKLAIGDREGLVWPTGKFTWRKTKDKIVTDWKSMAKGLAQQYLADDEARATLTGIYTRPEEGQRRIYFKEALVGELESE
jgi:predicted phage-related endonuclease